MKPFAPWAVSASGASCVEAPLGTNGAKKSMLSVTKPKNIVKPFNPKIGRTASGPMIRIAAPITVSAAILMPNHRVGFGFSAIIVVPMP